MASLFRRKKNGRSYGPWVGQYTDAFGDRQQVTFHKRDTEANAREQLSMLEHKAKRKRLLLRGNIVTHDQLKVADKRGALIGAVRDQYLEHLRDHNDCSEPHVRAVQRNLDSAFAYCGVVVVGQLETAADKFQQLLDGLADKGRPKGKRQPKSNSTISKVRGNFSAFCRWCVSEGFIEYDPAVKLKTPIRPEKNNADRRPKRAFDPVEFDRLCKAMEEPTDAKGRKMSGRHAQRVRDRRLQYIFQVWTGLRCTEASRLRRSDFDFEKRTVHIRPEVSKTGLEALQPIPVRINAELAKRFGDLPSDDVVFPSKVSRYTFERDLTRGGLPVQDAEGRKLGRGSLRKTQGTWMIRAGVDLGMRMKLRRDSGRGSEHLANWTYSDDAQAIDALASALAGVVEWHADQLRKAANAKTKRMPETTTA